MRATLKKPWISPRGKLYPAGTTFAKSRDILTLPCVDGEWYHFEIPGICYGMVLIPNSVFFT